MLIERKEDYEVLDRVRWCQHVASKLISETDETTIDGIDVSRIRTWANYLIDSSYSFDHTKIQVVSRNEFFLNKALLAATPKA